MKELTPINKEFYNPIQEGFIQQSGLTRGDFEREASFAVQHLSKNPYLQKANGNSILKAVMNVAQTGLTLNPVSKYAYLVPRYNGATKTLECVLDPSYTGLVKLLTDSGAVKSINCQLVYDGDDVDIDMASDRKITKHIPYLLTGKEKGLIKFVYSVATLHDGSFHAELMSWSEVEDIRDGSEAFKAFKEGKTKSCIWIKHEGEMSRKTCIKRHFKHLPKSGNLEPLEKAIDLSHVASGHAEPVSYTSIGMIESMLKTANLSEDEKSKIESEISLIEYEHQARKVLSYLNRNEQILGIERFPYSQKEIQELTKLKANQDE